MPDIVFFLKYCFKNLSLIWFLCSIWFFVGCLQASETCLLFYAYDVTRVGAYITFREEKVRGNISKHCKLYIASSIIL